LVIDYQNGNRLPIPLIFHNIGATVLKLALTNPLLLAALSRAGHGAQVLIADANYPASTASNARATVVELSIARGLPTVSTILELLLPVLPIEAAHYMESSDGDLPVHIEHAGLLAPIHPESLSRSAFYEAARGDDVAIVITTGDTSHFANLLLTVGAE
jgi:L-fucose mutarotase